MKRMLSFAAIAAFAMAMPTGASAEPTYDPECGRGGKAIHAEFIQPENGQLVVETANGTATFGGPDLLGAGVMVSTTGSITVEIDHGCVSSLVLTVYKGDVVIHENGWDTNDCGETTSTDSVEIGLDGGEYTFELSGEGCNFAPLVPASEGHYVGDPPLGI